MAYYESDIMVKTERIMGFGAAQFKVIDHGYIRCPMCDETVNVYDDDMPLDEYKKSEEEREEKNDRASDTTSDKTGNTVVGS
jgi:uncharacterized Zn finger protein (UPF0148 family)